MEPEREYPTSGSKPDFLFEGMAVGYFEEDEPHRAPGLYRYMPYRGAGHYYEMQTLRREGGSPRCYYEADGIRVSLYPYYEQHLSAGKSRVNGRIRPRNSPERRSKACRVEQIRKNGPQIDSL